MRGEVSGSGGCAGEEASGSDILTGYRLFCVFSFFLFFMSPPMVHRKEAEGGLHLLHGNSVCEGGEMLKEGKGVEQQNPAIRGQGRWWRERKGLSKTVSNADRDIHFVTFKSYFTFIVSIIIFFGLFATYKSC